MNEAQAQALADQVAAVDVLATVDIILTRPRHGSISASLAAIVAMAERIRDLDAIAAGAAELLAELASIRREGKKFFISTEELDSVIDALTGALTTLGYAQPTTEPQPRIQGDDT
jgi:hypothetical protein